MPARLDSACAESEVLPEMQTSACYKMKTSYQQYQLEIVRHAKKIGVKPEEILTMYQKLITGDQTDDVAEEYWRAIIETSIYIKDAIHIFVGDENFIDWIIEATPSLEDGMCEFWEHAFTQNVCVFHFPTKSKLITFAAYFSKNLNFTDRNGAEVFLEKKLGVCFKFTNPNRLGLMGGAVPLGINPVADGIEASPQQKTYGRLLCGLGMYLSCFPEMLKDGPPDDVKHPSHHQYDDIKTIGISPQVRVHSEHGEVTPHFRRGHFRVLRSEQFTKKRFQVVFVKQCFVKGEAATILSPEQGNN